MLRFPDYAELFLTARCNLRCRYCYVEHENSAAEWLRILRELAENQCFRVLFTGGEPLLRTDFPELVAAAVAGRMRFSLTTNGTLITPELIRQLAPFAKRCDQVQLSVDGPEAVHDAARGSGSFAQVRRGIALLRSAGFPVCGKLTIGTHNAGHLMAAAKTILEELALPFCATNYVSDVVGHKACLCPNINDFGTIMREYENVLQYYPNRFCNDGPYPVWRYWRSAPHPVTHFQCHASLQRLQISADGAVMRCLMLPESACGIVRNASLKDICSQMPDSPIEAAEECRNCGLTDRCAGRCGGNGSMCLSEYLSEGGKL
ncbi:MAG: radical SAM protein [Victivallaceae bacterium]